MSAIPGTPKSRDHDYNKSQEAADALQVASNTDTTDGPRSKRDPAICPTDDEHRSITAVKDEQKKLDKRSFDYLWRSGVAGGFAGCAVRSTSMDHNLLP
jgi:solute carrier family 25 protein 16